MHGVLKFLPLAVLLLMATITRGQFQCDNPSETLDTGATCGTSTESLQERLDCLIDFHSFGQPSSNPTKIPSESPSENPSFSSPSLHPSVQPTLEPSKPPTKKPTPNPTYPLVLKGYQLRCTSYTTYNLLTSSSEAQ